MRGVKAVTSALYGASGIAGAGLFLLAVAMSGHAPVRPARPLVPPARSAAPRPPAPDVSAIWTTRLGGPDGPKQDGLTGAVLAATTVGTRNRFAVVTTRDGWQHLLREHDYCAGVENLSIAAGRAEFAGGKKLTIERGGDR